MSEQHTKRVFNVVKHPREMAKLNYSLRFKAKALGPIPSKVDLRNEMPPVYDQGDLGSCTANAVAALVQYKLPTYMGSRLFAYYNSRVIEYSVTTDAGATVYDAVKSVATYGLCKETSWPYISNKFNVKAPETCYTEALKCKAITYDQILQTSESLKSCLAANYPIAVGIVVYSSFESIPSNGIVPMPNTTREECLGGHCVVCCGYDDDRQMWIIRNSWGTDWGDQGYCYLPYQYLLDPSLSWDFHRISQVTDPSTIPDPVIPIYIAPKIQVSATTKTIMQGSKDSVTITATNNDSKESIITFGSLATGSILTTISPRTLTLGPGQQGSATISLSIPATFNAATTTVVVNVTSKLSNLTASANIKINVTKKIIKKPAVLKKVVRSLRINKRR
jgi:hypothetical protein